MTVAPALVADGQCPAAHVVSHAAALVKVDHLADLAKRRRRGGGQGQRRLSRRVRGRGRLALVVQPFRDGGRPLGAGDVLREQPARGGTELGDDCQAESVRVRRIERQAEARHLAQLGESRRLQAGTRLVLHADEHDAAAEFDADACQVGAHGG